jgi:hypothetical protein
MSVLTAHKIYCVSTMKTARLMLFREIIVIYSEKHMVSVVTTVV